MPELGADRAGLEMALKKPRFFRFLKKLKNLKSPKFRFFYFLVKFYADRIKFHILIMICEFKTSKLRNIFCHFTIIYRTRAFVVPAVTSTIINHCVTVFEAKLDTVVNSGMCGCINQ